MDSEDRRYELHYASLCIKEVSDFKIRYTTTQKNSSPTIIELLLASEEIEDQGSGTYFNSIRLFDAKTKTKTEWNVTKISNQLPQQSTEWHFELNGNIRAEIEFKFNVAMISKNRPEGKFEFKVEGKEWKNISTPTQPVTQRLISSARQEWVQKQLDLIISKDITSNPFFHPKQKATSGAIRAHVEPDISHITYVGLDDAANFFSSIFGLKKKGVELKNLQVSLRYAKKYDVNTESTWLEKHPRVQYTTIHPSIHTAPWAKTDLIIDTYTIGEWFFDAEEEQYRERFEQEIGSRQQALNTNGKIILVYPTKPTPLCEAPMPSVEGYFDDPILMKGLGLKVIEKITKVGAAKGYVLEKIETEEKRKKGKDDSSTPPALALETESPTAISEDSHVVSDFNAMVNKQQSGTVSPPALPQSVLKTESLTAISEDLHVVSDFNALREIIKRRSRSIMYRMEKDHPMMKELVSMLTKKLYQHEGPNVIVVAGPPGIRKTTMVASALLPNEVWPEWSEQKLPSILVGTPKAAWKSRGEKKPDERRILFLDDLQDQLEDIHSIYQQENDSRTSNLEATKYFLSNLTGYSAVIATWKSEKEEEETYFDNIPHIRCIDMHIYNEFLMRPGQADNLADKFIQQHFTASDWVDALRQRDPQRFLDWIAGIKLCIVAIFSDPMYRCLESYVGCNALKRRLERSVRASRRQGVTVDPFVHPERELALLFEGKNEDPFSEKVVEE